MGVVIALVKLEILKAIHNRRSYCINGSRVVIALVKLEILKAIHNSWTAPRRAGPLLLH